VKSKFERASIEPQKKGFGMRIFKSLNEPVEECSPSVLLHGDVPGVVCEASVEGLTRERTDPVLVPLEQPRVRGKGGCKSAA